MKLIDEKTGNEVRIGDTVTNVVARPMGNKARLHAIHNGMVHVDYGNGPVEHYPFVIGCKIKEACEHEWDNASGEARFNRFCPKCKKYEDEV
jgi:hypothetical protein